VSRRKKQLVNGLFGWSGTAGTEVVHLPKDPQSSPEFPNSGENSTHRGPTV